MNRGIISIKIALKTWAQWLATVIYFFKGRVNWNSFFHKHKFASPRTLLQKLRLSVACVEARLYPIEYGAQFDINLRLKFSLTLKVLW